MGSQFAFHDGERAVQERAGEAAIAVRNFSAMADTVLPGARGFIEKQFMVALSSTDGQGRVWASLVFGKPGFLKTPEGKSIHIHVPLAERDPNEPFWSNIANKPQVGVLFIEIASRRRYRVNGRVSAIGADTVEVDITEAYPNCPKYIQRRHLRHNGAVENIGSVLEQGSQLSPTVQRLLRQADTLFVGSAHPERDMDASHRGGTPGFITLQDAQTLRIPDYQGNSLFNTFGNLAVNPHCGIVVPDFAGNRLLQLTGKATIQWDAEDSLGQTGGTRRFWDVQVEHWHLRPLPQRLEWEYLDASPFNNPVIPPEAETA